MTLTPTDQVWIEEAERRFQEIQRGEVEVQESDEVFREARVGLPRAASHLNPPERWPDLSLDVFPGHVRSLNWQGAHRADPSALA